MSTAPSSADEPYNAANPRHVKKRTDKAKKAAEQRQSDLEALLEQPAFRRWVWNLICDRCQIFQTPENPNGSIQSLNIGRQNVGRELFAAVNAISPQYITQMMTEHAEAKRD